MKFLLITILSIALDAAGPYFRTDDPDDRITKGKFSE